MKNNKIIVDYIISAFILAVFAITSAYFSAHETYDDYCHSSFNFTIAANLAFIILAVSQIFHFFIFCKTSYNLNKLSAINLLMSLCLIIMFLSLIFILFSQMRYEC